MKHARLLFFSSLLACLTISAIGQPTITADDIPPAGTTYTVYEQLPTTPPDPGPAGANQTWDFSSSGLGLLDSFSFQVIDAATAPNIDKFPSANFVSSLTSALAPVVLEQYMEVDASEVLNIGQWIDNGVLGVGNEFSNPRSEMTFPFGYESVTQDEYEFETTPSPVPLIHKGYNHVTGDGWGTLQLPWGTFNNTLRVHSIIVDSSTIFAMTEKIIMHQWYWVSDDDFLPLLSIGIDSLFTFPTGLEVSYSVKFYRSEGGGVGLSPAVWVEDLRLVGNAASEWALLEWTQDKPANLVTELVSLDGREVESEQRGFYPTGAHRVTIPFDVLNPGMYLLRVRLERPDEIPAVAVFKLIRR
jgi:hypothetical protein